MEPEQPSEPNFTSEVRCRIEHCFGKTNDYLINMIDTINMICAVLTVCFGLFGFLAPRYTASVLDLAPTKSNMGLSEMRASVGGLFVVAGLAALYLNHPVAYAMIGFAFWGAAIGRCLSLVFDKPPFAKVLIFGGIEAALAIWFLAANL